MNVTMDATFTVSPDAVLLIFDPPLGRDHLKEFDEQIRAQTFVSSTFPALSRVDALRLLFVDFLPMVLIARLVERFVTQELGQINFCLMMPSERDD